MGGAGALSDAAVSDNVWDNFPDIAGSNGNFPDHLPGRSTLHPQPAEQFSTPVGAENMAVRLPLPAWCGDRVKSGGIIMDIALAVNYEYVADGGNGLEIVRMDTATRQQTI